MLCFGRFINQTPKGSILAFWGMSWWSRTAPPAPATLQVDPSEPRQAEAVPEEDEGDEHRQQLPRCHDPGKGERAQDPEMLSLSLLGVGTKNLWPVGF